MSQRIEEFVLKAKFDKDEFEKNANATIDTLGRLEKSLDFTKSEGGLKGLQDTADSFSMKGVIRSLEETANKYSWFEQIAIGAYRKIGEAATSYLTNQVMNITGLNQAIAGWQKYESEVEAVQTIMNATGLKIDKVEEQLKKLGWYTDETSYKYGDMVTNIAKFNAAGITDLKKATDSMIGIANMAGYYGVNATKATGAMEGFAKAMGMGYMDQQSWKRIETAGMNALNIQKAFLDTAVELGKLDKKGDEYIYGKGKKAKEFKASEFKAFLKLKWLDQDVMNTTFRKYSIAVDDVYKAWLESGETAQVSELIDQLGASLDKTSIKAFKASQQAKTFTDVIDSLKEVVASGWRTSFKYIFGNYEEARDLWTGVVNELWDIFADSGYKRNDLLKGWYEGGGRTAFLEGMANMWHGIMAIINPIKDAFDSVFPATTVERLLKLTDKFNDFSKKFRKLFDFGFEKSDNPVVETIKTTTKVIETFDDACKRTKKNLDKLTTQIIRGDWGNGADRIKKLSEAGYVWSIAQNSVNKWYNENKGTNYSMHAVKDDGKVKLKKKTVEVEEAASAAQMITKTQLEAYQRSQRLYNTMTGIFSVVSMVKDVFKEMTGFVGKLAGQFVQKIGPAIDTILKYTSKWGENITEVYEKMKKNKTISKFFDNLADSASTAFAEVINWLIPNLIEGFLTFYKIVDKIAGVVVPIGGWVIKNIVPAIGFLVQKGQEFIKTVWNKITTGNGFTTLRSSIDKVWETIKRVGTDIWSNIEKISGGFVETFKNTFKEIAGDDGELTFGEVFAYALDLVAGAVSNFVELIGNAAEEVGNFFKQFADDKGAANVLKFSDNVSTASENLESITESRFKPVMDFLKEVFTFLKEMGTMMKDPLDYIGTGLKGIVDNVIKLFDGLNLDKLASIFKDTGIGLFFGALAKEIATGAGSIASIPKNFSLVLLSVKDVLVAYATSINAGSIWQIAKAIGVLTVSIIALGMMPSETLTQAVAALSTIMLVMSLLVYVFSLYQKFRKIQDDVVKTEYSFDFNGEKMASALVMPFTNFLTAIGTSIGKKINAGNTAMRFLSLAGAVLIIFGIVRTMMKDINSGEIDWSFSNKQLQQALILVGGITLFIAAISTLTKLGDNKATIGGALSFVSLALSIKIIVDVAKQIAEWGDSRMIAKAAFAMVPIGIAIVALGLAMKMTQTEIMKYQGENEKAKSKTSNSVLGFALALIAFALALSLMEPALEAIANYTPGGVLKVGAVILGLVGVIFAMGNLSQQLAKTEGIFKGIAAIGAITIMISMLVGVFAAMGLLMQSSGAGAIIGSGLLAFAAGIGAIAFSAWALDKLGATEAISNFAEAIGKFGVGIIAASVAILIFSKALPGLVEGLVLFGEKLKDPSTRDSLAAALIAIVTTALIVFAATKPQLFSAVFGWVKDGLGAMVKALTGKDGILTKLMGVITSVLTWMKGHKALISAIVIVAVMLLFGVLDDLLPSIVQRLVQLIMIIGYSLMLVLKQNAAPFVKMLVQIVRTIFSLLFEAITGLFEGMGLPKWMTNKVKKIADWFISDEEIESSLKELQGRTDKFSDEASKTLNKSLKKAQSSVTNGASGLNLGGVVGGMVGGGNINSLISGVGGFKLDALGINYGTVYDSASSAFAAIPDSIKENFGVAGMDAESGMATIENILNTSGVGVSEAAGGVAQDSVDSMDYVLDSNYEELKTDFYSPYLDGVEELEAVLPTHAERVQHSAEKGVKDPFVFAIDMIKGEMEKRADDAVSGFCKAFQKPKNRNAIWSAGSGVAKQLLVAYDVTSETSSPSRQMMWRGDMAILGLVNGVYDSIDKVKTAGVTVATALMDSVSTILDSDMDMSPTITPVLDMSGVTSGASSFNSLLSSPRISSGLVSNIGGMTANLSSMLASDAFSGFNQNQLNQQNINETINTQNADVVTALGLLRGDVNALNDSFLNTQVVLDSGALVGATARQMDNALGRINTYKGRGI